MDFLKTRLMVYVLFLHSRRIGEWSRKGSAWEPIVDVNWIVVAAKEIPSLHGYIKMMISTPDQL